MHWRGAALILAGGMAVTAAGVSLAAGPRAADAILSSPNGTSASRLAAQPQPVRPSSSPRFIATSP